MLEHYRQMKIERYVMSLKMTRTYDFNTPITGPPPGGRFNKELVKPLKEGVEAEQGIVRCVITRYHLKVTYVATELDTPNVDEIVHQHVKQVAALPKLFPDRGDVEPRAYY